MDRIERIVRKEMDELGGSLVMPSFEGGFIEGLDRILDALLLLTFGVDGVQSAFRDVGRSAEDAAFLHDDDARAGLGGGNGCSEARPASSDDADVGLVFIHDVVGRTGRGLEFGRVSGL